MNPERLLALYDRVAEAPDAIARLRRFVLDLAVRGKLVEQDLGDEPAKISRAPSRADLPFDLPTNWRWMRIGEQLDLLNGMAFKPTDWVNSGLRIVRIQNLNNPAAPFNYCRSEMARERSLIEDGSFLISWSGTPGTSFGAFIWGRGPAVLNQHIFRCDFRTTFFDREFLKLAVNGRLDEMIAKAHGGVGLQHITKGKLEAMLIPLPPLAEQRRIVAKVEELMALLDRLEAARQQREATRDRLTAASLARLTAPDTNAETFPAHARFALDALPALTTRPDQIKPLRQIILNLAVRGKLVAQDPTDKPVPSGLLLKKPDRKQPTGRTGASLGPVERSEVGFDLPEKWTWSRLFQLCEADAPIVYGILQPGPDIRPKGVPYIRPTEINDGRIDLRSIRHTTVEIAQKYSRASVRAGDLLVTIVGTIGAVAEVPPALDGGNITQSSCRLRTQPSLVRSDYLRIALTSDCAISQIERMRLGAAIKRLNIAHVRAIAIPLPPLAEQQRIVAKVDALMALCDRLQAALTTADTTRARLLESLLKKALAPAAEALEAAQ